MELVRLIERKAPCKDGMKRKEGKCVKLTAAQKKAAKLRRKKSFKDRIKDSILRAKLDCGDGFTKYKVNGKYKCVKTKACAPGSSYSVSQKKCIKTLHSK